VTTTLKIMRIAIIVPCYNEQARLDVDYWRQIEDIPCLTLIFVNDGSTDETQGIIDKICSAGRSRSVDLPVNVGKSEAVRIGLRYALGDSDSAFAGVGFIDCDGAFTISDVQRFVDIWENRCVQSSFDAVWSARIGLSGRAVRRTNFRHYVGRIIATLVSVGLPQCPYDTQSGFKLWRKSSALMKCTEVKFRTRWFFEVELLQRWLVNEKRVMSIWEEPVESWQDVPGSKIGVGQILHVLSDLFLIKRLMRLSLRQIRSVNSWT